MPQVNEIDTELWWLIGILAVIFLLVLLVGIAQFANDFSSELRYLNNEIHRTDGEEQKHWKRRRRRLWLSLIPLVRY